MAAITSIVRAQQLFLGRIDAVLRPLELTFARYEVLMLLLFSRRGALPLNKIGARLQVHPTSVTNAVDRLEEQGLIKRVPHSSDRRTTLAEILPVGRELALRATRALNDEVFSQPGMGARRPEALIDVLQRFRQGRGIFPRRSGRRGRLPVRAHRLRRRAGRRPAAPGGGHSPWLPRRPDWATGQGAGESRRLASAVPSLILTPGRGLSRRAFCPRRVFRRIWAENHTESPILPRNRHRKIRRARQVSGRGRLHNGQRRPGPLSSERLSPPAPTR